MSSRHNPKSYLFDARNAAQSILRMTAGRTYESYEQDEILRAATERQLQILGEAIYQLEHWAPEILSEIPNHRDIIRFRHVLVHHYEKIDHERIWSIVELDIEPLIGVLDGLLE